MRNGITATELSILECNWGPGNSERSHKPEIRLRIKPGSGVPRNFVRGGGLNKSS